MVIKSPNSQRKTLRLGGVRWRTWSTNPDLSSAPGPGPVWLCLAADSHLTRIISLNGRNILDPLSKDSERRGRRPRCQGSTGYHNVIKRSCIQASPRPSLCALHSSDTGHSASRCAVVLGHSRQERAAHTGVERKKEGKGSGGDRMTPSLLLRSCGCFLGHCRGHAPGLPRAPVGTTHSPREGRSSPSAQAQGPAALSAQC